MTTRWVGLVLDAQRKGEVLTAQATRDRKVTVGVCVGKVGWAGIRNVGVAQLHAHSKGAWRTWHVERRSRKVGGAHGTCIPVC